MECAHQRDQALQARATQKTDCGLTKLGHILRLPRRLIMKFALIVLVLLLTTGVVYAACVFC
jgi:hypothetical protein